MFELLPGEENYSAKDLVAMDLFPSVRAVYRARKNGTGPDYVRVGTRILYPRSSVQQFIRKSKVETNNKAKTN